MAGSAAHLVDRVLPTTPIRQYVLAFPYELSGLAATRPEVLAALSRIFWESRRSRYREWAKSAGYAPSTVETGATMAVSPALVMVTSAYESSFIDAVAFDGGPDGATVAIFGSATLHCGLAALVEKSARNEAPSLKPE